MQAYDTTAFEAELKKLFAAVLDVDTVDANDDFFELGGDSLTVIRLVTRVRRELHVEILPGDVFDCPTVAALAQFLRIPPG